MDPSALPPGAADDRASYVLSVTWIEYAISVVFIALRFWSRVRITRNIWWDDWAILVPFVFITIASALFTVYVNSGGAHHVFYLAAVEPENISKVIELNYVAQVFCIMAIATGKFSVALLIYRLQPKSKWRTWLLIFLSVSSFVVAILIIAVFYAQCTPVQTLWIPTLPGGHCWDPKRSNDWDIAGSSYFAFVDFVLALLPITFLWNLQMKMARKLALCALLGLGTFAGIAAAIKASYLPTLTAKSDVTWITVKLLIWNATEMNVIVYAACLPAMRPLFLIAVETVSIYATGKRSLLGRSSNGNGSGKEQHYKIGGGASRLFGATSGSGENFAMNRPSDEAHILPQKGIERTVDVDVYSRKQETRKGQNMV